MPEFAPIYKEGLMAFERNTVFCVAVLAASLGSSAMAAEPYPNGKLLIEPSALADRPSAFKILDARPRDDYDVEHIPEAVWVPHHDWEKAFHEDEGRNRKVWQSRIAKLGISSGSAVVVYDDNLSKDAARIWWILRHFGVKDARLLNGGWKGWSSGGFPTSREEPNVVASDFRLTPEVTLFRDLSDTLRDVKQGSAVQIVDARSHDEHCGIELLSNARGGSIPGAKHLEWSDLLDKQTARFKTVDELRRLFDEAGIDPTQRTVTHCQSGGRASVMAFGLELMGGERVANYYRGWSEWGNTPEAPIAITKPANVVPTSE